MLFLIGILTTNLRAQQTPSAMNHKSIHRIPNLQQLLKADTTNNSIIELDNFIGEICDYGEHMERLSESQFLFYLNQNLEREVNNGGFNQYFNNPSGDYALETVGSLKAIGAYKTANVLETAIAKFPGKKVPKNRASRIKLVKKIDPEMTLWEDIDQLFMAYEEDLNFLNLKFVEQHSAAF